MEEGREKAKLRQTYTRQTELSCIEHFEKPKVQVLLACMACGVEAVEPTEQ